MPLYRDKLDAIIQGAFEATVDRYAAACQDAFRDPVHNWPRETKRRNGSIVASPRDITDTGKLQNSQQAPKFDGLQAEIIWDAPHALITHEGDGGNRPARRWTVTAAQNLDITETFIEEAKARL